MMTSTLPRPTNGSAEANAFPRRYLCPVKRSVKEQCVNLNSTSTADAGRPQAMPQPALYNSYLPSPGGPPGATGRLQGHGAHNYVESCEGRPFDHEGPSRFHGWDASQPGFAVATNSCREAGPNRNYGERLQILVVPVRARHLPDRQWEIKNERAFRPILTPRPPSR
ncbi:hypothetical protein MRX96_024649 [Rhipicephalus microplus]